MTARVDGRGATYDVYFPTVGLHSDVRPSEGDLPQSRSHFRGIMAGLAVDRRLDWFAERLPWDVFQRYQGATNLLVTELKWRHGPIRVMTTDFMATGPDLPRTKGGSESPGQYLKRFRITNEGTEPRCACSRSTCRRRSTAGSASRGSPGTTATVPCWRSTAGTGTRTARSRTTPPCESRWRSMGEGQPSASPPARTRRSCCEVWRFPPGRRCRSICSSAARFTGWRGDQGTFEHWLRPALSWFREADLDHIELEAAAYWDNFVEPLPSLAFPRPAYAVSLRRSALSSAMHADSKWGAIAAGFDRGLNAYCWPRDAMWAGGASLPARAPRDRSRRVRMAGPRPRPQPPVLVLVPEVHD